MYPLVNVYSLLLKMAQSMIIEVLAKFQLNPVTTFTELDPSRFSGTVLDRSGNSLKMRRERMKP